MCVYLKTPAGHTQYMAAMESGNFVSVKCSDFLILQIYYT